MKKIFLLTACLLFTSFQVFADCTTIDNPNWGIQPASKNFQKQSPLQKALDEQRDQAIYENYGSEQSPAFLNRENIDPQDSDSGGDYSPDYDDDNNVY